MPDPHPACSSGEGKQVGRLGIPWRSRISRVAKGVGGESHHRTIKMADGPFQSHHSRRKRAFTLVELEAPRLRRPDLWRKGMNPFFTATPLHPSAQGCEATLGSLKNKGLPQRGCIPSLPLRYNPFRVGSLLPHRIPRVARASQPWAGRFIPFGESRRNRSHRFPFYFANRRVRSGRLRLRWPSSTAMWQKFPRRSR
jgi:hypothetical protein